MLGVDSLIGSLSFERTVIDPSQDASEDFSRERSVSLIGRMFVSCLSQVAEFVSVLRYGMYKAAKMVRMAH